MTNRSVLRRCMSVLIALFISACGGGGGGVSVELPNPAEPPPPPAQANNVNINNPTLTVADNDEVSPGDALTLVWSDEFDAAQLDPEAWFFEEGDGSQYGIPGGGNNELHWYPANSAQLENGRLVITARAEPTNGMDYTSS